MKGNAHESQAVAQSEIYHACNAEIELSDDTIVHLHDISMFLSEINIAINTPITSGVPATKAPTALRVNAKS